MPVGAATVTAAHVCTVAIIDAAVISAPDIGAIPAVIIALIAVTDFCAVDPVADCATDGNALDALTVDALTFVDLVSVFTFVAVFARGHFPADGVISRFTRHRGIKRPAVTAAGSGDAETGGATGSRRQPAATRWSAIQRQRFTRSGTGPGWGMGPAHAGQ